MSSLHVLCVCLQAAEVERQLSTQVHSLRDDFREKSLSTSQHLTRLETLQAEVSGRLPQLSVHPRVTLSSVPRAGVFLWSPAEDAKTKSL